MSVAVFGYGSLVDAESAARTLGRPVPVVQRALLRGWRRRWSEKRDNLYAEKTFALEGDGRVPRWIIGLNVEPADGSVKPVNGILIELSETELDRLDVREIRYHRVDVTDEVEVGDGDRPERVITYTARPECFSPAPPDDAVVLANYFRAVEGGFEALGPGELDHFRRCTGKPPVEVVEGKLVRDEIPPGNPREW
jgi:cation transport regulator ChaC